jgi:outer membrane lipoprotein SlyB
MTRYLALPAVALIAALASGCATYVPPPAHAPPVAYPQAGRADYGTIYSIDVIRAPNQTTGAGGVIGGVTGAVVGRQFGSGSGRSAGTLIGAVAGAIIGNEIERQNRHAQDIYRVVVRTDAGQLRAFDYVQLGDVRVGDRVRVENNLVYRY